MKCYIFPQIQKLDTYYENTFMINPIISSFMKMKITKIRPVVILKWFVWIREIIWNIKKQLTSYLLLWRCCVISWIHRIGMYYLFLVLTLNECILIKIFDKLIVWCRITLLFLFILLCFTTFSLMQALNLDFENICAKKKSYYRIHIG